MGTNASNVTSAKPSVNGALSVADLGSKLPTDSMSTLDAAFKNLGYISEDGLTNQDTRKSEDSKAWGGDIVDSSQSEKSDKFKCNLLEILNIDVLKEVYGAENVSGTLESGLTIKSNSKALKQRVFIFDMVLKDGRLKRIVIPKGKINEVGDITYGDKKITSFPITISAFPDNEGNTHYEYIQGATK